MDHIQITAQAVAAAIEIERERCAMIAEKLSEKPGWSLGYTRAAKVIADLIRASR